MTELFLIMIARNYGKDTADQTRARLTSNCWRELPTKHDH